MSSLSYALRVRDLVHGYVYLTDLEVNILNHPLFQRLRHIRQNDVAFYVYPSINTSRLEHSLGCLTVAGEMATNLVHGVCWPDYQHIVDLDPAEFEQICRLYALLHDVGHLPLSHLFEMAFEDYANRVEPAVSLESLCKQWFGGLGFAKLHEACGSVLAEQLLNETNTPDKIRSHVLSLMQTKKLERTSTLRPIKLLIDSEVDADRIDATARDGLLAGGEYGSYDIHRLCRAVFLRPHGSGWRLAYSHKALSPIEALLLDRCRTHTNIHFHHRVVALKVAAIELIARLLTQGLITKDSFPVGNPAKMAMRDDIWLWSLLRQEAEGYQAEDSTRAACRALLYRDKETMIPLWKNRSEYSYCDGRLKEAAELRGELPRNKFDRRYEQYLSKEMGVETRTFWLRFRPLGTAIVPLTNEQGSEDNPELTTLSALTGSLGRVWDAEPKYYIVLLGKPPQNRENLITTWVNCTATWLHQ